MSNSDFGLVGLAVMGQNLVLNVESRGFKVSVFNRTTSVTEEFVSAHPDNRRPDGGQDRVGDRQKSRASRKCDGGA